MAGNSDPESQQDKDTKPLRSDGLSAADFVLWCPNCHQPIPFDEQASHQLVCHQCGSSFRVENNQPVSTIEAVRLLGRFQLLDCVGQGTFGAVWRARDTQLQRIVAVKVPHRGLLSSASFRERFQREARAAAQLDHPGIVRLYEVPTLDGMPALISDFIDGVSLYELIESRRLTFPEAAALVADVAEALECAHTAGLVHRDIKPGNIMVKKLPGNGLRPVIVDFGLALRSEAEIVMTVEGQIIGTPAYMSPEQARGDNRAVDVRSDIYSLGVVLYQLLTGELPFRGSKEMMKYQLVNEEPKPPRRINDKIPRDLETICLKAMAKLPGWRFQRAGEVAEELRRFLKGEPIQSRSIGRIERTYRWCRRNPLLGLAAAVVFIGPPVLSLVVAGFWFRAVQSEGEAIQSAHAAEESAKQAAENEQKAIAEKNESERGRYASDMNRVQDALRNGQVGLAVRLLEVHRPANNSGPDLRGFEWYYLERVCSPELHMFAGHKGSVHSIAFSPDGQWVASGGGDSILRLWNPATGEVRDFSSSSDIRAVAFSPDGRLVASGNEDGILRIWEIASGKIRCHVSGQHDPILSIAFSPNNRHVAFGANDGGIRMCDPASGHEFSLPKAHSYRIEGLAFSPHGDRLVSASADRTARVWDVEHSKELRLLSHAVGLTGVAWSPDGRWIATAALDDAIHIWDAESGKEVRQLTGHRNTILALTFDAAGRHIASASGDQTIRIWDTSYWRTIRIFRPHADAISGVAFDPNGRRLASCSWDGFVKILDPTQPQDYTPLEVKTYSVNRVAYAPNGKSLASITFDAPEDGIRFWDLLRGQTVARWRERQAGATAIAYSPDGKLIATASDKWSERLIPGELKIRDATTGSLLRSIRVRRGPIKAVAWSSDSAIMAWGEEGGAAHLYDTRNQKEVKPLQFDAASIDELAFAPNSRILAVKSSHGDIRQIQIWDTTNRQMIKTLIQASRSFRGVSFSPNGRWLAVGDSDHTIHLWDTTSWDELPRLPGHSKPIESVVFFPDNQRLASAGSDYTIKIWDLETREDLLTLQSDAPIESLAISPDGFELASCGNENVIRLWNARLLGRDARAHREALGVVKFFCAQAHSQQELEHCIQGDQTISDSERAKALALAVPYWENWNRNQADDLVARLTYADNARPKAEILEIIRTDKSLSQPVRAHALELAKQYKEDPEDLNWGGRKALSQQNRASEEYRLALRQAQRAHELDPKNASYLTTVGMACYRMANYEDALKALEQAGKLHSTGDSSSDPTWLAFLAMAQHQLGKRDEAKSTFERLREIMKTPAWANDAKAQAFFREAQAYFSRSRQMETNRKPAARNVNP
jgi:WD40 repeat protein